MFWRRWGFSEQCVPLTRLYLHHRQRTFGRNRYSRVRSHERPRLSQLLRQHEWEKVHFAEGTLREATVVCHAVVLLVIRNKVLDARADAALLRAAYVRGGDDAGEPGVLGKGLEATAAERVLRWHVRR